MVFFFVSFSTLLPKQDFVPPEVVELLQGSKNTLIQELFQLKRNCTRESDGTRTVKVLPRFNELKIFNNIGTIPLVLKTNSNRKPKQTKLAGNQANGFLFKPY